MRARLILCRVQLCVKTRGENLRKGYFIINSDSITRYRYVTHTINVTEYTLKEKNKVDDVAIVRAARQPKISASLFILDEKRGKDDYYRDYLLFRHWDCYLW